MRNLMDVEFEGMSGRVSFTETGDRYEPRFSIVNFQKHDDVFGYKWKTVGWASLKEASFFDRVKLCYGGLGCNLSSYPSHLPPVPPDRTVVWTSIAIVFLCLVFLLIFCSYRRKKIAASREQKTILQAKEAVHIVRGKGPQLQCPDNTCFVVEVFFDSLILIVCIAR